MLEKKIPAPLTPEELKQKINSNEAEIIFPEHIEELNSENFNENDPDFTHIEISSVGYRADMMGIDSKGEKYPFPGGPRISFNWAVKGFGFGELTIKQEQGRIIIDCETLGKEFLKQFFANLIKKAEIE